VYPQRGRGSHTIKKESLTGESIFQRENPLKGTPSIQWVGIKRGERKNPLRKREEMSDRVLRKGTANSKIVKGSP